jgi:hypothetical protein
MRTIYFFKSVDGGAINFRDQFNLISSSCFEVLTNEVKHVA